jgi:hypothetical protein
MGTQQFDGITRLAANAPDRRNMLKVVAAAALTGVAGAALRPEDGLAHEKNNNNKRHQNRQHGLVNVVITDVLNNLSITIPIKGNNVAVQVCAVVEAIDVDLLALNALRCDIQQRQ